MRAPRCVFFRVGFLPIKTHAKNRILACSLEKFNYTHTESGFNRKRELKNLQPLNFFLQVLKGLKVARLPPRKEFF